MTKLEFISRYGEDAWNDHLAYYRNYYQKDGGLHKQLCSKWKKEHKEQCSQISIKCNNKSRQKGSTKYCRENFDLIENYELAKADNFDPKKWHLHHRLENYWSVKTLKRKGLYFYLNPEALIWLPADEHNLDSGISRHHPELSKWHKRILE